MQSALNRFQSFYFFTGVWILFPASDFLRCCLRIKSKIQNTGNTVLDLQNSSLVTKPSLFVTYQGSQVCDEVIIIMIWSFIVQGHFKQKYKEHFCFVCRFWGLDCWSDKTRRLWMQQLLYYYIWTVYIIYNILIIT